MAMHEANEIIKQIANKYNLPSIESQSIQHDPEISKQLTSEIIEECSTSSRAPSERLIQLIDRINQQRDYLNLDLSRIASAISTVPIIARINPRLIWFLHTNQIFRVEEFVNAVCQSQQSFEIFTTSFARQVDNQVHTIRSEPTNSSPVTQMVLYIYQLALPFVARDIYVEHRGDADMSTASKSAMPSDVLLAVPSAHIICRLIYPPPLAGVNDQLTIDSAAVSLQARREVLLSLTSRLHPVRSLSVALKSHFVAYLMLSPLQTTINQHQIDQMATWMISRHNPEQVAECIRLSIVLFDSWVIRASGRRRNKRTVDGNVKHDEFLLPTATIQATIHSFFRILRNSQPVFEMLTTCLDYAWKHQSADVLARSIQVARILLDQSSQFGVHLTLQRKNAPVAPFKPPADFTQWWKLRIEPFFAEAAITLNDGATPVGSSPDRISANVATAKSKRKPVKFALKQTKTSIDDDVAVLDDEAILTMDVDPESLNASKDTVEQRRINRARRVDAEERRAQFERQAEAERLRQAKVNASTLLHCLEMTVEFDPEFILSMLRRWTQQFLSGLVEAKRLQSYLTHAHRRCHQIEL